MFYAGDRNMSQSHFQSFQKIHRTGFLLHEVSLILLIWTPTFSDSVVTWQPLSFEPQWLLHFSFQASFAVEAYKANRKGQQHAVEVTRAAPWIPTALHAGRCSVQHTFFCRWCSIQPPGLSLHSLSQQAAQTLASCGMLVCCLFCLANTVTANVVAFLLPSIF